MAGPFSPARTLSSSVSTVKAAQALPEHKDTLWYKVVCIWSLLMLVAAEVLRGRSGAMKVPRLARRIFKGFAATVIFGVLGIGLLSGSLWPEHRTEVTLPRPTGAFAVGRAIYDWADVAVDTLAPVSGTKRELLVWIWYPAAGQSAAIDDYLPAPLRAEVERSRGALISTFLTRNLSKVHAYSTRNSEVSSQQRSYPVVIMRAGASGEVWNYSSLAEDLASHGYVVVGFDAPYRTNIVV